MAGQQIPGQIEPINDELRLTNPLWYAFFLFLNKLGQTLVGAWTTTFTPVATASAGAPTVITSCRYTVVGRTVNVQLTAQITALGGATGALFLSLPVVPASRIAILMGTEISATGKMVRGTISAGGSTASIAYYDNSSVLAVGVVIVLNGTYEV